MSDSDTIDNASSIAPKLPTIALKEVDKEDENMSEIQ